VVLKFNQNASLNDPNYRRRLWDEDYPDWFQGVPNTRPDYLLKQLQCSYAKSANVACVQQPGHPNVWTCRSASLGTDGDHFGYKVDLHVPECSCQEFGKWRLPCKHFIAVMKAGTVSFDSLPEVYRSKPFFGPVRLPLSSGTRADVISVPDKRGDIPPLNTEPIAECEGPKPNTDTPVRTEAMAMENELRHLMYKVPDEGLPDLVKIMKAALNSVGKLTPATVLPVFNNPHQPPKKRKLELKKLQSGVLDSVDSPSEDDAFQKKKKRKRKI